ncbi:hypothetical protein BGW36DRAFT_296692, partial [Talaromyces proteolyticus]
INETTRGFASIQKRVCLINGASRTTAAEALNIELHLLSIKLQLRTGVTRAISESLIRQYPESEIKLGGYIPMEVSLKSNPGLMGSTTDKCLYYC